MWVMRPVRDRRADVTYDVFDPEGRLLGEVSVPVGMSRLASPLIGSDYFMGAWVGGLGVETVRVYDLRRGG